MNTNSHATICSVCDLEILEKSEWTNKMIGDDYYISFRKIGENIICSQNHGDMKNFE